MDVKPYTVSLGIGLAVLASLGGGPAFTQDLTFEGRVEPSDRAALSSQLDAVVSRVHFRGGERVAADQALITLDSTDAELALRVAEAQVAEAQAKRDGAAREAQRQTELRARGVAPDAVAARAGTALAEADAALALAKAERDRALLSVERAIIRAPIAGIVSQPNVTVGAFLEAEAGPPLATILTLDPVRVAYRVPYGDRLASLQAAGADTLEELFERIEITLTLPGGVPYGETAKPEFASPSLDPETGALTVWATLANPDMVLRPGLEVTVHATIKPAPDRAQ